MIAMHSDIAINGGGGGGGGPGGRTPPPPPLYIDDVLHSCLQLDTRFIIRQYGIRP